MKEKFWPFLCGLQTGVIATVIALFFIPGPAPPEGGCKCSSQATDKADRGASVVLDNREICGLTEVSTETEPGDAYRPSLGEYIFTAARRCRPCGTNCRCGAICRCPK